MFTDVVPCKGSFVTVTLAGFNVALGLPLASLAKVLSVTGVLTLVVVISVLTTGPLLLGVVTSITVIFKGTNGQFTLTPDGHTGTLKK